MAVERERLYTAAEFENFIAQPANADRLFELIDGEIVEKMPTEERGELALIFGGKLRDFAVKHRLGCVGVEVRHRLPEDDANSRLPDISFIAGQRKRVTQGSVPQMPDLAVEIKSPNDSYKVLRERASYYLANGTQMFIILDPPKKQLIVLTSDAEQTLGEEDTFDGGAVLPGFRLPVREIFDDTLEDED